MKTKTHGFSSGLYINLIRSFARIFIFLFQLNNTKNRFGIELNQLLRPIHTINTESGRLSFLTPNGRLLWRAEVLLREEPLFIKWINTTVDKNSIFLDLGSNVGTFSCYALSKMIKFCYCCELDFMNIPILYQNLFHNNFLSKSLIIPFAASSQHSIEEIYFRDLTYGDALQAVGRPIRFETTRTKNSHKSLNFCFPLDSIFKQFKLDPPTHIKIDINGNERIAIDGMKMILRQANYVYFEYSNATSEDCTYCISQIVDCGYREIESCDIISTDGTLVVGKNTLFERVTF